MTGQSNPRKDHSTWRQRDTLKDADPGGWEVGRAPVRGARRSWGRAVAGALSTGGLAAAAFALALVLAAPTASAGATTTTGKTVKISTAKVAGVGTVLTTASGLTLYRFTDDEPGKSMCTGACAKIWPPLLAAKGAHVSAPHGVKGFSLLTRQRRALAGGLPQAPAVPLRRRQEEGAGARAGRGRGVVRGAEERDPGCRGHARRRRRRGRWCWCCDIAVDIDDFARCQHGAAIDDADDARRRVERDDADGRTHAGHPTTDARHAAGGAETFATATHTHHHDRAQPWQRGSWLLRVGAAAVRTVGRRRCRR